MDLIAHQFFNIDIMRQAWPLLLRGLGMTLLICAAVISARAARRAWRGAGLAQPAPLAQPAVQIGITVFRALPPLVLLILIYAGLPFAGIRLSPFTAVCLAFLLNNASFYGEIFRAGIESIGRGQWEAARSTGLRPHQTMTSVILPQAIRNVLPDLVSNTIEVVKLSSLASVVALPELLHSAEMARSVTYNASPVVLAAAFICCCSGHLCG